MTEEISNWKCDWHQSHQCLVLNWNTEIYSHTNSLHTPTTETSWLQQVNKGFSCHLHSLPYVPMQEQTEIIINIIGTQKKKKKERKEKKKKKESSSCNFNIAFGHDAISIKLNNCSDWFYIIHNSRACIAIIAAALDFSMRMIFCLLWRCSHDFSHTRRLQVEIGKTVKAYISCLKEQK